MQRPNLPLLALLTSVLFSTAQAANTVSYNSVAIAPETQELDINAWIDTGFPEGQVITTVHMNCASDGKPSVTGYKQDAVGDWVPDGTKTAAAQKSTAIKLASGAITIPNLAGDIRFVCKDRKLVTDFSKFLANPNATFIARSSDNSFNLTQDSLMPLVTIEYPITSDRYMDDSIRSNGVTVELLGKGFKKVSGIRSVDFSDSSPKTAIFVLDTKNNVLVPGYYNGRSDSSKLKGVTVGDRLDLYYTPDYSGSTGWRKLSIDFKNAVIWTENVSKPNYRIVN